MIPSFETSWLVITGGNVVLPGGTVFPNAHVLVKNGIIQDITDSPLHTIDFQGYPVETLEAFGHWVTPGLIDQHLHGAFGIDFNQSSIEKIHELLYLLPQHGITSVVPTVMTAAKLDMVASLSTLEEVINTPQPLEAHVLGLHLEGPFLHPDFKGAHPKEELLIPTKETLEGLLPSSVKRVTLAPEVDANLEITKYLNEQGILCSMGHSGADYLTATEAIQAGVGCATHLFNAMAKFDHRHPNILTASLLNDDVFVELIADGQHLSPLTLQLTLKAKPFEKTILISDCNALTGLPAGSSMKFGKQQITIHPEGALNEEGRLAGSTALITDCVRNLVKWNLLSFPHAIQLATRHPAHYLKENPHVGELTAGAMADIVLWRKDDLGIAQVLVEGEFIEAVASSQAVAL